MLKSSYFSDTKSQVGRYVDHDAAIEESALAQLFTDTTEAWNVRLVRRIFAEIAVKLTLVPGPQARYNVPYSVCACTPSRGVSQPKQLLSSLKSRASGTASAAAAETKAEYSAAGYADGNISHPSELLCVTYVNHRGSQQARQKRAKEAAKKAAEPSQRPCPLGDRSGGGIFLKPIPRDVHFGSVQWLLRTDIS